ncbi:N-(5'-phosphoribosyl)anthranilate isomerase [Streptomyces inusitatus]|uniref:N-(5'-phosphoribosyl)anthranilate isomerase n=1 Tax=Streptomyces inusitatus TaxID=68221 RepID=A0A918Q271_9ACTN|nr:phosphoribosylanthranilate isomerase [Streptomyces inusitatus]GGZ28766.1 N-(5'-phosphoribosyl)anthranilate isomerase [Streptomyces inusitatus]
MFIKVCGLRTEAAVDAAVEAEVDAIGFMFARSPRHVDASTVIRLMRRIPPTVLTVGVFRDQPLADVRSLVNITGVLGVQLHGKEGRPYYEQLSETGCTLIRGLSYREPLPRHGDLGEDILLLDAPVPGAGVPWDWGRRPLRTTAGKWLLAGGLTPDNVGDAVRATNPWGVDVSSGIEISRGQKDPALIASFAEAARAARAAA